MIKSDPSVKITKERIRVWDSIIDEIRRELKRDKNAVKSGVKVN